MKLGMGSVALLGGRGLTLGAGPLAAGEGVGSAVRFGFITDLHNDDQDPSGTRYYRDVPEKLADAVAAFNSRSIGFIFVNGDVVNGTGGSVASTTDLNGVLTELSAANAPCYLAAGNHDYQAFTLSEWAALTGMDPQGYYYFDVKGTRFICLDANYEADDDGSHYSAGGFTYTDTYINPAQRDWLEDTLESAPGKCVVFCHQRLEQQTGDNYVKNADAVRAILEASGKVMAVFMGHAHTNSLTYIESIPYVVMQALIEGAHPLNAFAIVTVDGEEVSIEGYGQQTDWGLLDPYGEARPLLDRFTTPATDERAALINETIIALEDAGLTAKLDGLYMLAAADEQAARQNWIQNAYNLVATSSPTFVADQGFQGDGVAAYLSSTFYPALAGGKFSQNSASIGVWVNDSPNPTTGSSFNYAIGNGTTGSGATFIRSLNSATTMALRINSPATPTAPTLDADKRTRLGMRGVSRTSSSDVAVYANGVKQGSTISNTSATPASSEIRILRSGTGASAYCEDRVCAAFWGEGLSDAEMLDLYEIIRDYLIAIGAWS